MALPFYEKIDWLLVICIVLIAGTSLLTLHSVAANGGASPDIVLRQAAWFAIAGLVMVFVTSIDYHLWGTLAYPMYAVVAGLLVLVMAVGDVVKGSQRWLRLGPVNVQPSELAKIAMILVLAQYFSRKKKEAVYITDLVVTGILAGVFMALILKEPDLGTTLLLMPIFAAMVFVAGLDLMPLVRLLLFRPVLILLIIALTGTFFYQITLDDYWRITDRSLNTLEEKGIPIETLDSLETLRNKDYTEQNKFLDDLSKKLGKEQIALYQNVLLEYSRPKVRLLSVPFLVLWLHLKEYQRNRLISFIDPTKDALGSGYHVIQSQIAIGSGGFWGKGYMHGTQSQLKFLPEQYTDFIFSVYSEEWGFIGSIGLLAVYLMLILRGIAIADKAKDRLGKLIAVGVVTLFVVQTYINVGVTTGIMPVTGMTLLLMSYGGSSILTISTALGLLLNVSYRRLDF
jgi:rod shape determining protein RodA